MRVRIIGSVDSGTSERDLLVRFRELDPDAWETVYRRSYSRLVEYARRRLPSTYDPHDAVSECLTRAVDRIGDLADQGVRVEAWLYGILRLVVLEQIRRSGRQERERPVADSPLGLVEATNDRGPLEHVLRDEQVSSVRVAFERLSIDDQEVLWLRQVAELSVAEVAEVLRKGHGAVRQANFRALARLRTLIEEVDA
ncbi:sigma-70 family RNA polymerase sigma factor [Aeromicrobium alkaliterrae]|uniref:Sigma-70 family RNA polymerase sigma factor n=1 Tax=Aeromicrobium alkaliterrae TaxID=302168 RepID=A0ABN2JUH6_9ACTN